MKKGKKQVHLANRRTCQSKTGTSLGERFPMDGGAMGQKLPKHTLRPVATGQKKRAEGGGEKGGNVAGRKLGHTRPGVCK